MKIILFTSVLLATASVLSACTGVTIEIEPMASGTPVTVRIIGVQDEIPRSADTNPISQSQLDESTPIRSPAAIPTSTLTSTPSPLPALAPMAIPSPALAVEFTGSCECEQQPVLDIVVANQGGDNVTVLIGDGKRSFLRHINTPFYANDAPQGTSVGDFNEDGYTDIVVDNWSNTKGTTVSVLINDQGTGSFYPPKAVDVGLRSPQSNVVADFNNDDHLDIAVANWNHGQVTLIFGNGDGTFTSDRPRFAVGNRPHSISVADLNNDGLPDLVTGNVPDHTISILINDSTRPGRQFDMATLTAENGVGKNPGIVVLGDVNNDGYHDIIVRSMPDQIQVFLNDRGGNGENFSLAVQLTAGNNPRPTLADVDGDGNLDIVSANLDDNSVSIHLNSGAGVSFGPGTFIAVNRPNYVVVADLDNDDTQDIIVTSEEIGGITILFNDGSGSFGLPMVIQTGISPTSLAVADFDRQMR